MAASVQCGAIRRPVGAHYCVSTVLAHSDSDSASNSNSIQKPNKKRGKGHNYKCLKTNLTIDDDNRNSVLVDSGFSGLAVIGSATLARLSAGGLLSLLGKRCSATNSYTFGAGDKIKADYRQRIEGVHIGQVHVDVVPGDLPFLIGREFLRRKNIKLDFEKIMESEFEPIAIYSFSRKTLIWSPNLNLEPKSAQTRPWI